MTELSTACSMTSEADLAEAEGLLRGALDGHCVREGRMGVNCECQDEESRLDLIGTGDSCSLSSSRTACGKQKDTEERLIWQLLLF